MNLYDTLFSLQLFQELIFADEDLLGFVSLFHLEGNVTAALVVTCVVDYT